MSVLCVSDDTEAVEALSLMLARVACAARFCRTAAEAELEWRRAPAPLVVIDTGVGDTSRFVDLIRSELPGTRVVLMLDPRRDLPSLRYPSVPKPFDAVELADALCRELELARSEQQQLELKRTLEHSERLAAIGRIAASMAHEINNPLSVVSAAAEQVENAARACNDPALLECSADLDIAVDRIRTFVDHVCGYARKGAPELHDASMKQSLDLALRLCRPRALERAVSIEVIGEPDIGTRHDPTRMSQAILNLLSNAIDAAAAGGHHVTVSVLADSREVWLHVDDDGPGVDASIAAKLFEPFATTKPPGEGTGLGLAITRQIVEDHGGVVSLAPRPRSGTRASIRLPRHARTSPG